MDSTLENSCISPDVQFEERFVTGQGLQDNASLVTEVGVRQTEREEMAVTGREEL